MKSLILFACLLFTKVAIAQKVDTTFLQIGMEKIHTVLTNPDGQEKSSLAILIAGSGPTDLNGNQPALKNNSLLYLSDSLVKNNIATLRFDKRGVAKSASQTLDESKLTIDQFAADLSELIKHGKKLGYQNIYLIGHSEGSLISLISAQKTEIAGFISLCGAGNSIDLVLKNQLRSNLPTDLYKRSTQIIDSLKEGHHVKNIPSELYMLFRPSVQNYLISWFRYSPAQLLAHLKSPSLIIQGTKDLQVDIGEARTLSKARPDSELILIENMNHVLKKINGGELENKLSYNNPELPVHEDLVKHIVKFIR